jgi:alanine racemase
MRIRSEVISLRDIEAGGTVGYGRSFRAERETRVATIPVGYADGFMRQVSDRAHVLVAGVRCPVIGNVSMDLTAVDVTDCGPVMIGQEVVLLGEQGGARIDANELAQASRTIPYEVLTSVSRRVPRFVE